jgi:Phage terminase, small subunit
LTVVDQSKPNPLAPPASLGKAGAALWLAINRDYLIEDSGGHEMLRRICEAADNIATYDEEIGRDGVTLRSKGNVREHPLLKHRQAAQSFVVRSLHRLGLDITPARSELGRPSGGGAYRGVDR